MEREDLERAATSLIERFNASDWDDATELVSPEIIYEDRTSGSVVHGREGFIEAIKQLKGPRQDIAGYPISDWVVDEGSGTVAGELSWESTRTEAPTVLGALFIVVQDGHIIRIREQHFAVTATPIPEPGKTPIPKRCPLY